MRSYAALAACRNVGARVRAAPPACWRRRGLIGFFAAPTFSRVLRVLIPLVCLAVAAFLVLRAVGGADALSHDLKVGRVQFAEGAIGKSSQSVDEGNDICSLDVGDSRFNVMPMTYDAAPDAGYVRLYFLPTSRIVVNLERLPDPPVEIGAAARDIVQALGAAARFHDRRMLNEARASMAGLGNAMKAGFAQPLTPPADTQDPRPLGKAILGMEQRLRHREILRRWHRDHERPWRREGGSVVDRRQRTVMLGRDRTATGSKGVGGGWSIDHFGTGQRSHPHSRSVT